MTTKNEILHKLRLLHIVHGLSIGGAEIALFQYIKAMGNDCYDHYVYCFGADGPVRDKILSLGVPVYMGKRRASIKNPIQFGISLVFLIYDLLRFIRKYRIQIIQSHSGYANQIGVIAGKLCGLPAFPTVHSTMAFVDPRSIWDLRVHLIKVVDGIIYRIAYQILAVSQEIKEIILKTYNLPRSKVFILKNGIALDNTRSKSLVIEKEIPDLDSKIKIVAVGRLVALKCFDVLIKAVAEVFDQGLNNIHLLIVGDGPERKSLDALVEKLDLRNCISLLGMRNDVMEIMNVCDIFVIPSRFEGLSIAMIEAMACSLPVIASDVPGLRDHVKDNVNGFLFPVGDHRALADRIIRLAGDENLRMKLSSGAKSAFDQEYDMRKNIKPLEHMFRKHAHTS